MSNVEVVLKVFLAPPHICKKSFFFFFGKNGFLFQLVCCLCHDTSEVELKDAFGFSFSFVFFLIFFFKKKKNIIGV